MDIQIFILTSSIVGLFLILGIISSVDEKVDKQEVVIPNKPENDYLLCLGNEVKEFKGDAVKSANAKNNQIRPILVNAETVKRHFLVMATIGAGKSVLMKGLMEQHIIAGGGLFCIDGKGTAEFAKEIYGLCASLGREDDFVYLNFLDMDNTHTINPLTSGDFSALFEILQPLLMGEEDFWQSKAKEFMLCVLKLCVWKRDNEPDFILDFSYLTTIMNLTTLARLAIKYKHLAIKGTSNYSSAIEDFVKWVALSLHMGYDDFLNGNADDIKWVKSIEESTTNDKLQGVYNAGVAISKWSKPLMTLGSDYGRIFNAPKPDMSLWEATQRNKIIFVTLPTMNSDTTPKELGRLLLSLIKAVAAQKAEKAREPKIPYIVFADELGSYVIEGFGRLESKSRSLGISIVPFFQSPAQIDVVAKNDYERKEIIDVTGVHILMKNMHPETTEFYAKMIEKEKVIVEDSYRERKQFTTGQGSVEDSYKTEERDAIKHFEVQRMNGGEMIIFSNGKMHRAIARAETTLLTMGKKITYEGNSNIKIPITQYVAKDIFFKEVKKTLNNDRLNDILNREVA